jgi:hypothetical protein
MDYLDTVLNNAINSPEKYCQAIRTAITVGKRTLTRYYNKTDYSEVYRTAMGLFFCFLLFFSIKKD